MYTCSLFSNIPQESVQLRNAITKELQDGEKELDMLNWVTRCALELVGRGGLGHSFDPLDRDWKNPFVTTLKSIG